jgi:hypothetical protein
MKMAETIELRSPLIDAHVLWTSLICWGVSRVWGSGKSSGFLQCNGYNYKIVFRHVDATHFKVCDRPPINS